MQSESSFSQQKISKSGHLLIANSEEYCGSQPHHKDLYSVRSDSLKGVEYVHGRKQIRK
jgi:hypothetical protein